MTGKGDFDIHNVHSFGDPFKITLFKDENDLIEMLSERPDYTSEEGDPAPVVYKNGERIGELKR